MRIIHRPLDAGEERSELASHVTFLVDPWQCRTTSIGILHPHLHHVGEDTANDWSKGQAIIKFEHGCRIQGLTARNACAAFRTVSSDGCRRSAASSIASRSLMRPTALSTVPM